jgi:hypothetical protein
MKRISLYSFVLIFLIISCKEKAAQEKTSAESDSLKAFFAKLPPPLEVAARIQATGADFNPAILSIPANAAEISGDKNKNKVAANLGIYLSDMGYCIVYKQKEDVAKYYNAASLLADSLGVKKDLLGYIMKRYEQNLENNDSMKTVLSDLYATSTNTLEGDEAITMKGIVASALYIESLHSLMALIETYPKDMLPNDAKKTILASVYKTVLNQKENIINVHNYLLASVKNAPKLDFYNNGFNELVEIYDRLQIDDKIANNKFDELFKDETIQRLIFRVENLRNEIVKPSGM